MTTLAQLEVTLVDVMTDEHSPKRALAWVQFPDCARVAALRVSLAEAERLAPLKDRRIVLSLSERGA